jgi:hypothetical protein
MRLWMIVTDAAMKALERDGELVADGRRTSRDFRLAYRWMAEQMTARIGPPPRPGALPLWAWAQWLGPRQARPDLRCSCHLPPGRPGLRLAGASYRTIAEVLFGADRVAAEPWKTSSLRGQVLRLVAEGRRLMRGRYRQLLRPPKRRPLE